MPLAVLVSPVVFISAGSFLESGDGLQGALLLGIGTALMIAGIFECNLKDKNE